MNRKGKVVVVAALGIVALGVTTGSSVLAGAGWPPEPYQEFSLAGSWTDPAGGGGVFTMSPPDARTGTGSITGIENKVDPTNGGAFPQATSWSPWFGTYVMTGPNTYHAKAILYVRKDGKPEPAILNMYVLEVTGTQTAPDMVDYAGTYSLYSAAADKDGDNIPDAGEVPIDTWSLAGTKKRI